MRRHALGALLVLAGALRCLPADAELVRAWTFEQPVFGRPTLWPTDHCFVPSGGLWHLFYTHRWTPEEPYRAIGHATSPDRRHWTEHAAALLVGPGDPSWRSVEVWAPYVAAWPAGGWVMAFTGVNPYGSQQTGFLWSEDLESWAENPAVPPVPLDPGLYNWGPTFENDNRDPHLFFESGTWHLLYAAHTGMGLAAVGHSSSPDLVAWTHHPPLLTVGTPWQLPDLESPGLVAWGGYYYLYYSYLGVRVVRGTAWSGPWLHADAHLLGPASSGGEIVPSGDGHFLSRIRVSSCDPDHPVLWFDSLDTSGWPLARLSLTSLDDFPWSSGSAFTGTSQLGDPQLLRGEPPAGPTGLYWLSSRESGGEPFITEPCSYDRGPHHTGELRSVALPLDADTVRADLLAGTPSESVFVALRDACTHAEIARVFPVGPTLAPQAAVVTPARGRRAEWRIVDQAEGPGGWIGADQLELRRWEGRSDLGPGPVLGWTRPAGGEVWAPGSTVYPRWTASHPAGIDSFYIYLTDYATENLVFLRKRSGSSRTFAWTLPDSMLLDVRLRVVAFGKDQVVSCLDSNPFYVTGSTAAPDPAPSPPLSVERRGSALQLVGRVPGEATGPAVLEVFDVRGRRIATPWRGHAGESFAVPVPVADAAGRLLARGVYFARLRAGDAAWTARYVRLSTAGR
jgi:hypothetical protein